MRSCYFALMLLVTLTASQALAVANRDAVAFPRPSELAPDVQFWTKVYTEVDTKRLMAAYRASHPRAD